MLGISPSKGQFEAVFFGLNIFPKNIFI